MQQNIINAQLGNRLYDTLGSAKIHPLYETQDCSFKLETHRSLSGLKLPTSNQEITGSIPTDDKMSFYQPQNKNEVKLNSWYSSWGMRWFHSTYFSMCKIWIVIYKLIHGNNWGRAFFAIICQKKVVHTITNFRVMSAQKMLSFEITLLLPDPLEPDR